jgi:hypothetical protein
VNDPAHIHAVTQILPIKAFETKISQKNPDYQGLAEFKALTLRVNCDEKKFDTQLI